MSERLAEARWLVKGRVQGVGFRWWTKTTAEELGVLGSVRNLPDGSVEVRAAADPAVLQELERLLHSGPRFSRVDEVAAVDVGQTGFDGPAASARGGFEILS
jgi:acylphosphatase